MMTDVAVCSDWSIRTSRLNEGRLEICLNNVWTTVGDSQWDYNDARAACTQLGYYGPCKMHIPMLYSRIGKI